MSDQLHPYGTQWGPMHWGHVSSTDMLNWKREPIMFAPSLEQEKDGVFSGSAVIDDNGDLRFYYTGHRLGNGHDNTGGDWQVQMTALPDNDELTSATKQGMIIDCPTDKVDHHYRDPKVWKTGDTWYMTFGVSSADKRGQMWLFSSKDMVRWEYERVLFQYPWTGCVHARMPRLLPHQRQGRQREVGHWLLRHGVQAQRLHEPQRQQRRLHRPARGSRAANSSRKPSSACGIAATTTTPRSPSMWTAVRSSMAG